MPVRKGGEQQVRKSRIGLLFLIVLAILVLAGCASGKKVDTDKSLPEHVQPVARDLKFVSSDQMAGGCASCHMGPLSLSSMLQKMNHPPMPMDSVSQCLSCHGNDKPFPFKNMLHKAHKIGTPSAVVTSCVACHTMGIDGVFGVKGMLADGFQELTIKATTVDDAPDGCNSCHQTYAGGKDYSLKAETTKMNAASGHPVVPAADAKQCLTCHKPGGNLPLSRGLHLAHLVGEQNYFVTTYGASCLQCHVADDKGSISVKGLR